MFKTGLINPVLRQFCLGRNENFHDLVLEVINTELMSSNFYRSGQYHPTSFQSQIFPTADSNPQSNLIFFNPVPFTYFSVLHANSYVQFPQVPNFMNAQLNSHVSRCNFCNNIGHDFQNCQSRLSSPFCMKCGSYGHLFSVCPTNTTTKINVVQTSNSRKKVQFCKWCRQRGHSDDKCFIIKRYQQSRNSGIAGHGQSTSSVTQDQN